MSSIHRQPCVRQFVNLLMLSNPEYVGAPAHAGWAGLGPAGRDPSSMLSFVDSPSHLRLITAKETKICPSASPTPLSNQIAFDWD